MLKIEYGNLLDMALAAEFDMIIHGCNCFYDMSGGIAAQIGKRFPQAKVADEQTKFGDTNKLGKYSMSLVRSFVPPTFAQFIIVNAYTQYNPGRDASYQAIESFFINFKKTYGNMNLRIGIPEIGCGIGGLEGPRVKRIIGSICREMDVTMVIFKP